MCRRRHATTLIILAALVLLGTANGAEAKLGESALTFKVKTTKAFKFKSETKKEDRSYHMFAMILDPQTQQGAPGFNSGITLTVVEGKIVGQAMVIRMGDNFEGGKALAVIHAMDFVYEALGKPAPKNKSSATAEYNQFSMAIEQVLAGYPQHVKYPGFPGRITLSRTNDGDLLLAATPDFSGTNEPVKSAASPATTKPGRGAPDATGGKTATAAGKTPPASAGSAAPPANPATSPPPKTAKSRFGLPKP